MPNRSQLLSSGHLHRVERLDAPGFGHRALTLYLPPGFDRGDRRFPVAYFFDGQNLFGDRGSFSGGWHLHEALDKRVAKGKAVPIVVGIHHGGASRLSELSPWSVRRGHPGRADGFLDWMVGPLAKTLAAELPIQAGPEGTVVAGSSLGGLMALYAFFRNPEFFGGAMCMSPSLWVHRGGIFNYVERQSLPWTRRVYLDSGGREGRGQVLAQTERMSRLLEAKGFVDGTDLMWRPDKRGSHNEHNWRRRLPKALKFFYG